MCKRQSIEWEGGELSQLEQVREGELRLKDSPGIVESLREIL